MEGGSGGSAVFSPTASTSLDDGSHGNKCGGGRSDGDDGDGDPHFSLPSFTLSSSCREQEVAAYDGLSRPTSQDDVRALYVDALLIDRQSSTLGLLEPDAMRSHDAKHDLLAAGLPSHDRLVSWDQRKGEENNGPAGYDVFTSVLNDSSYFKSLAEHRKYRLQQRVRLEEEFEAKARDAIVNCRAAANAAATATQASYTSGDSNSLMMPLNSADPGQLQQSLASARGFGIPEAPLIKRITARAHVSFTPKRRRDFPDSPPKRLPETGVYLDSISTSVPHPHATRLMIQKQQQRDQHQDQRRRSRQLETALFEW